jgi:N-acetyl-gamma-glutamyl-phosphate reductase
MQEGRRDVALFGATGYSGREAARILGGHPAFRLAAAFGGRDRAGVPLASLHPSLRGTVDVVCESLEEGEAPGRTATRLRDRGIAHAVTATPEAASMAIVPALLAAGLRVVDLSGAFRLGSGRAYADWYGEDHAAPQLFGRSVYGLTEWARPDLARADLVANPGCYPTAALLALLPLRRDDLIDTSAPVVVHAISGASGAGRRLRDDLLFCEIEGSIRPYGLPRHRHLGEIAERGGFIPGEEVLFLPHLAPVDRGLICSMTLRLRRGTAASSVAASFARAYDGAPFVRLPADGALPSTSEVRGSNVCAIGWSLTPGTRQATVVSVIDNLIKGAAGQAIQNLNVMCGRPEGEGLPR